MYSVSYVVFTCGFLIFIFLVFWVFLLWKGIALCCKLFLHQMRRLGSFFSISSVQFIHSVTSDSLTPWTAACQASLSITNSQSLLKFMSVESVMPSNRWFNIVNNIWSIFISWTILLYSRNIVHLITVCNFFICFWIC